MDCQTNMGYTPLHRCAFYNHPRLGSLLVLAGATQSIRDFTEQQTPYEVSVARGNVKLIELLKPMFDDTGRDVKSLMYATNNPKHPQYRPEARAALLQLMNHEALLSDGSEEGDEGEGEGEDEWEDVDDVDGDEENESESEGEGEGDEENDDENENTDNHMVVEREVSAVSLPTSAETEMQG